MSVHLAAAVLSGTLTGYCDRFAASYLYNHTERTRYMLVLYGDIIFLRLCQRLPFILLLKVFVSQGVEYHAIARI